MENEAICSNLIEPLQNKITHLIDNLASKEDLWKLFSDIEIKFKHGIDSLSKKFQLELQNRNDKIIKLKNEVESIKESRNCDIIDYNPNKILERLEKLELNYEASESNQSVSDLSDQSSLPPHNLPNSLPLIDYDANLIENVSVPERIINDADADDESEPERQISDADDASHRKEILDLACVGDSIVRWVSIDSLKPGELINLSVLEGGKRETFVRP